MARRLHRGPRATPGARAGGAAPGAKRGMTGGELVVRGSAGREAGALMRRGLLAVGGDAGSARGAAMIAGHDRGLRRGRRRRRALVQARLGRRARARYVPSDLPLRLHLSAVHLG